MKTWMIFLWISAITALAQPAQIILLRHAEKPGDDDALHLSRRGEERARALVSLLGKKSPFTSNAPIAALYATRVTRHGRGQRTGETLAPLAKKLRLTVQTPHESESYASLAREVLRCSDYRGKTVVICWNHSELADLAAALGVKPPPPPWKDKTFDRLWLIKPSNSGTEWQDLPQRLFKGDSKR